MTLLNFFRLHYYTVGLLDVVEIAALIVAIRNYRRRPALRIFPYYIAASVAEEWSIYIVTNHATAATIGRTGAMIDNVFMVVEFAVCITYILRNIASRARRIAVYIDVLLFLGFLVMTLTGRHQIFFQTTCFMGESFFLLLPCLLYFYDLFKSENSVDLKDNPSFWIITGILLLNAGEMPMALLMGYGGPYHEAIFSLNFILYSLFFLLLIRAYRCPPLNSPLNAILPAE